MPGFTGSTGSLPSPRGPPRKSETNKFSAKLRIIEEISGNQAASKVRNSHWWLPGMTLSRWGCLWWTSFSGCRPQCQAPGSSAMTTYVHLLYRFSGYNITTGERIISTILPHRGQSQLLAPLPQCRESGAGRKDVKPRVMMMIQNTNNIKPD